MNKSSGVSYIGSARKIERTEDAKLSVIDSIAKNAVRDLSELLQSMFDGIDDSLFELANSARTNNEQNRFFEAMREIRIKRKGIESQFSQALLNHFAVNCAIRSPTESTNPDHPSLDGLSIVGNDELEEEVAITAMASKAQANFQGQLLKFKARMSKAYGVASIDDIQSPLDPKGLCEAFALACQSLEIEIKEKLIVFKQFDRYVMGNLETVVDHANRLLVRHGIMPQLKTPGVRHQSSPNHAQGDTSPAQAKNRLQETHANTSAHGKLHEQTADIFPELQALLADTRVGQHRHRYNGHNDSHATHHAELDTSALLALLTRLQKQPEINTANSKEATVIDIRRALQNQLDHDTAGKHRGASFNQIDEDLINLVSMLFEFILDDYNLAPPIQVLISRLQIPILKVVIKDKSFFSSSRHPARQLLNSLAKAGIGWGESVDQPRDKLYAKIRETVHRILDEFDGDISLFRQLNDELTAFMAKEDRKAKIVEQRTKEAEKGRIRSKQAQLKVEALISNKVLNARHPIPQVVSDMLRTGWSRVMFLAFLKDDTEHQWLATTRVVDDLIWCLQPLTESRDRQRWVAIVPKLLKEIKSGLENVSYSAATLEQTMLDIKQELTSAFRNPDNILTGSGAHAARPATNTRNESAVEKQLASRDQNLDHLHEEIDQLAVGQWVEFELLNGSKFRCKLSAIIEEADCFIFVNRMGLKTVEKTRDELLKELNQKKLVILEQGQAIDRALSAVMTNLKQKANT